MPFEEHVYTCHGKPWTISAFLLSHADPIEIVILHHSDECHSRIMDFESSDRQSFHNYRAFLSFQFFFLRILMQNGTKNRLSNKAQL